MTDSILRADAMLSARLPGVTASSLRSGVEGSVRSAYDLGRSALHSVKSSIPEDAAEKATPFTVACFLIIAVEFGERFVYYTTKLIYGSYTQDMLNMSSKECECCAHSALLTNQPTRTDELTD